MDTNLNRKPLVLAIFLITIVISMGCTSGKSPSSTTPTNQQPVEVVSVLGTLSPINPGGPIVEITLKNISGESVISLSATLQLNRDFNFNFNVTSANPLLPDKTINTRQTLISGSFSDNTYPLLISGTLQNGVTFGYTKQVQIVKQ